MSFVNSFDGDSPSQQIPLVPDKNSEQLFDEVFGEPITFQRPKRTYAGVGRRLALQKLNHNRIRDVYDVVSESDEDEDEHENDFENKKLNGTLGKTKKKKYKSKFAPCTKESVLAAFKKAVDSHQIPDFDEVDRHELRVVHVPKSSRRRSGRVRSSASEVSSEIAPPPSRPLRTTIEVLDSHSDKSESIHEADFPASDSLSIRSSSTFSDIENHPQNYQNIQPRKTLSNISKVQDKSSNILKAKIKQSARNKSPLSRTSAKRIKERTLTLSSNEYPSSPSSAASPKKRITRSRSSASSITSHSSISLQDKRFNLTPPSTPPHETSSEKMPPPVMFTIRTPQPIFTSTPHASPKMKIDEPQGDREATIRRSTRARTKLNF